jgi:hypothetical protein
MPLNVQYAVTFLVPAGKVVRGFTGLPSLTSSQMTICAKEAVPPWEVGAIVGLVLQPVKVKDTGDMASCRAN